MKNILVTGARGFIGSNIVSVLTRDESNKVSYLNRKDNRDILHESLQKCDYILHLAGVNRPDSDLEFQESNVELTEYICNYLEKIDRSPKIIFSSSTQVSLDNPYGQSKKLSEKILKKYSKITSGEVVIYRLPGVFGKWSRPNYNSVVATFCNNILKGLPVELIDKNRILDLVYIDDVVKEMLSELNVTKNINRFRVPEISNIFNITVGDLYDMLVSFSKSRVDLYLPKINDYMQLFYRFMILLILPITLIKLKMKEVSWLSLLKVTILVKSLFQQLNQVKLEGIIITILKLKSFLY